MSSIPDFSSMTDEEIAAHVERAKQERDLLYTYRDPRKQAAKRMVDPQDKAKQQLRVLAKVAGRNERQARQAAERKVTSDAEYQAGVVEYCKEYNLQELPEDFAEELGEIWTYHNTPQKERPE